MPKVQEVTITAPMRRGELDGYTTVHVELQMVPRQAEALRRLLEGLQERAVRLSDGKFIQRPPDAVRFLLEQLADRGGKKKK